MASENGADDQDRRPTERVILQRATVMVVPEDVDLASLLVPDTASLRKMGVKAQKVEAWVEVARNTAPTKKAAIEAYAGKAGTATAKVGEWRAPSSTAWKGGLKHSAPPKPLIEAEAFE